MLDIYEELLELVSELERENISYALCGGLALAVYDVIRATVDIDLLILTQDLDKALETAQKLGFVFLAIPMVFAQGKVQIHRASKVDPETDFPLSIDFLLVTEELREVWTARRRIELEDKKAWVVSRDGLIQLKMLRGSTQDMDDIQKLGGSP
jgi:hypothetical protein